MGMQINQARRHQPVPGIDGLSTAVRRNISVKRSNGRIFDGNIPFRPQVLARIQDLAAFNKKVEFVS